MDLGVEGAVDVEADVAAELVVAVGLGDGEGLAGLERALEEEVVGVGAALVVELDEARGVPVVAELQAGDATVALAAVELGADRPVLAALGSGNEEEPLYHAGGDGL